MDRHGSEKQLVLMVGYNERRGGTSTRDVSWQQNTLNGCRGWTTVGTERMKGFWALLLKVDVKTRDPVSPGAEGRVVTS